MAITYTTAPNFGQLEIPAAASCSALASAFNDRLRNGLADPTRRIHLYVMNLYRSVRNPSDDIPPLYPSQYEFGAFYSYVDPVNDQWPPFDAGTYEGANEANPAMQQIFGSDDQGGNTEGEGDTFNKFGLMIGTGGSAQTYWEQAKLQRGGYDLASGSQNAPMLEMAQSHSMHVFPWYSRYHKSYGGYLPVPEENTDCTCTDPDGFTYRNWKFKWTRLSDGEVTEFDGVCPPDWSSGTCDTNNHIAYIYRGPYSDKVWTYGGDYYEFLKTEYIEGPYTGGGYLERTDGDQINRLMLNPWMIGFRGTDGQRSPNCFDIRKIAFSNFEFYEAQYLLAPAYGTTIDDEIDVQYPTYTIGPGSSLPSGTSSETHTISASFVAGGFLVVPVGLSGQTTLAAKSASVTIGEYSINDQTSSYVFNFTTQSVKQLSFELTSTANFTSSAGRIEFESSDLYEYKPQLEDGYALMRMCYSQADNDDVLDTIGENESQATSAYDYYISSSCAVNIHDNTQVYQQEQHANTNPLLDASRRYCNSFTRLINGTYLGLEWDNPNAQVLLGYEVVDNKSSLYFKRYTSNGDDMWQGIINQYNTSSNGIQTTALVSGWTNEWLMFVNTKAYSPSEANIFKPSVYSNYFPYINRCHVLPDNNYNASNNEQAAFMRFALEWHPSLPKSITDNSILAPETLPAYNYDVGLNVNADHLAFYYNYGYDGRDFVAQEQARKFYTSCQIYPKDYVVESVTGEMWDGDEVVKVTFTERIQNHEDAPIYISKNIATWNKTAIQDQDYRTDENAIMQFLIYMDDETNAYKKLGDSEVSNVPSDDPYTRYGAIWPTFYFTKLIPKPYESDSTGSCACTNYENPPMTVDQIVQMETYLRAICEGYIDDTVSTTYACDTDFNTAYDYTYENLIYDASNGSNTSIPLMATATRPDKAKSYGPLPNMRIDAATINMISAAVNKLTKVRLIIPWNLYTTTQYFYGDETKTADITPAGCSTNAESWGIFLDYAGAPATTPNGGYSTWYENTFTAETSVEWLKTSPNPCVMGDCFGDDWLLRTARTAVSFSFQLRDPLLEYAINGDIKSMLDTPGQAGFFGSYVQSSSYYEVSSYDPTVGGYDPTSYCGTCASKLTYETAPNNAYKWDLIEDNEAGCAFFTNGVVDLGAQMPVGDISFGISKCGTPFACNNVKCSNVGTSRYIVDVKNTRDIILNVPLS